MADTKQGQVDWGALAESSVHACDGMYAEDEFYEMWAKWLRTTFEPLVKTAEAALACEHGAEFGNYDMCHGCESALRAALDRLPKVGG